VGTWRLVAVSALLLLLTGGGAFAGAPVTVPAIDAYVETFPTSTGDEAVGVVEPHAAPLPAAVRARLRRVGRRQARVLVRVATSSQYGAPTATLPAVPKARPAPASLHTKAPRPTGGTPALPTAPAPRTPPARRDLDLLGVFTGPDSGAFAGLAAVLAAATVAAFAWVFGRRARQGS
jgi:hypothetical protein